MPWVRARMPQEGARRRRRLHLGNRFPEAGVAPHASFADASLGTFVKEFLYEPIKDTVTLNTEITKINFRGNKATNGKYIKATKADGKKLILQHHGLAQVLQTRQMDCPSTPASHVKR